MWDWEGTLLDPSVGGGSALSSKILDFEKTYFCGLFSAKIYLYNPNDRTHGMQCMVVDGPVIRSKPFIDSSDMS